MLRRALRSALPREKEISGGRNLDWIPPSQLWRVAPPLRVCVPAPVTGYLRCVSIPLWPDSHQAEMAGAVLLEESTWDSPLGVVFQMNPLPSMRHDYHESSNPNLCTACGDLPSVLTGPAGPSKSWDFPSVA